MANNEVKILMTAVDKASAVIKSATDKINKAVKTTTVSWTEFSNALQVADKVLGYVKKAFEMTVGTAVAYNKTIREMTLVTGLGADEISRIIQVADDWGISIEEVRTSLAFMNKQGIEPSIDNLAKMADEYVASTDKAAWANQAVKVLGRGYQTLIPILAQGGDALRKQTDAVDEGLIATQETIDASREYEVALDNLNDKITIVETALGNELVPTLVDVLDLIGQLADVKIPKWAVELEKASVKLNVWYWLLKPFTKAFEQLTKDVEEGTKGGEKYVPVLEDGADATYGLSYATGDFERAQRGAAASAWAYQKAQEKARLETEYNNDAMRDLNTSISGQLDKTMEDFIEQQGDIEQQMKDVQAEIDLAISQGYDPLGEKVLGLKDDYIKLEDQYGENAIAHDRAMKEIMFDLYEAELAVDGFSTAERIALENLAKDWGLPYAATVDYLLKMEEAETYLARTGDADGMRRILEGQATAWSLAKEQALEERDAAGDYKYNLDYLDGKVVNTYINEHKTTYYEEIYGEDYGGGGGGRHAAGADFVIPPGFNKDNYPLGYGSTGERVIVIPKSQVNHSNYTMNVHTNAQSSSLIRDFAMMKAMSQ